MTHEDSASLIAACGGASYVAGRLRLTPMAVRNWRKRGLSEHNEMAIKGAFPTIYARWKAEQEKADELHSLD